MTPVVEVHATFRPESREDWLDTLNALGSLDAYTLDLDGVPDEWGPT